MKETVIVFDFDKTLTEKDTILGFYRAATNSKIELHAKLPFYYLIAILTKLKFLSNDTLKDWGIKLFLRGKEKKTLEKIGVKYSNQIKFNQIYYNNFLSFPSSDVLIISASFEEYLNPLFPDHEIIASKINYSNQQKAVGISKNVFGQKKALMLKKRGIYSIDVLYTDSFSDKPLMDISKSVYFVEGNKIKKIENK